MSNLSVSLETPTSLCVSWHAEEYEYCYQVTYTTHCGNQLLKNTINVYERNINITDLEEGMKYNISVTPVCDGQMGLSNSTSGITTEVGEWSIYNTQFLSIYDVRAVPAEAPDITNAAAINGTAIFVAWDEIDCLQRNGNITNYIINITSTEGTVYNNTVSSNFNNIEIPVQYLSISYEYNVTIAAVNSAGIGVTSAPFPVQINGEKKCFIINFTQNDYIIFVPNAVPGPVKDLTAEMTYSNATLRWNKPSFNPDIITHYEVIHINIKSGACLAVELEESDLLDLLNATTLNATEAMIVIPNLSSNTCYIFAVRAFSLNGPGLPVMLTDMTLPEPINTPATTQMTPSVAAETTTGSPTLVTTVLPTTPTIVGISVLILAAGAGGGALVVVIVIVVLVCIVVSVFTRRYTDIIHKCLLC